MSRYKWKKLHLKAFKLYLLGHETSQIATELGIDRHTVWSWARRGDWPSLLDKNTKQLKARINIDVLDEKERSLKLIKAAESYWVQKMQSGEMAPNFADLAGLQRMKWEILAPTKVNQYNFMNTQNTINEPKYILKIVKEDHDHRDDMETESEAGDGLGLPIRQEN